jgi:hypothetical protein
MQRGANLVNIFIFLLCLSGKTSVQILISEIRNDYSLVAIFQGNVASVILAATGILAASGIFVASGTCIFTGRAF